LAAATATGKAKRTRGKQRNKEEGLNIEECFQDVDRNASNTSYVTE
jgi:hypothetical protein